MYEGSPSQVKGIEQRCRVTVRRDVLVTKSKVPETRNEMLCLIPVSERCDCEPSILDLSTDPRIFEFTPIKTNGGRLKAPDDWVEFLQIRCEQCVAVLGKGLAVGRVSGEEEQSAWLGRRRLRGWLKVDEGSADHRHIVVSKIMTILFVPWIPQEEVAFLG